MTPSADACWALPALAAGIGFVGVTLSEQRAAGGPAGPPPQSGVTASSAADSFTAAALSASDCARDGNRSSRSRQSDPSR